MSAQILAMNLVSSSKQDNVLIHVRYHPNSDVSMIDERPGHLSPKEWLAHLWTEAPQCYLGLSGGRGFFRIPRETFDAILGKA
jgi:hypothetical protein